jgi:hypothetical protein
MIGMMTGNGADTGKLHRFAEGAGFFFEPKGWVSKVDSDEKKS